MKTALLLMLALSIPNAYGDSYSCSAYADYTMTLKVGFEGPDEIWIAYDDLVGYWGTKIGNYSDGDLFGQMKVWNPTTKLSNGLAPLDMSVLVDYGYNMIDVTINGDDGLTTYSCELD